MKAFYLPLIALTWVTLSVVFMADVSSTFKLLPENDMGERVIASPVPVAGRLLIRGEQQLVCIRP